MTPDFSGVLVAYGAQGSTVSRLGKGNINETYLVVLRDAGDRKFVLQRISSTVFPEPEKVIANFITIEEHFSCKYQGLTFPISVAQVVKTREGRPFHRDGAGNYWRAQTYLENFQTAVINSDESGSRLGSALATFHRASHDLDPHLLHDPLPGFHKLDNYLRQYEVARLSCHCNQQDAKSSYCLQMLEQYREQVIQLLGAAEDGRIPRLVTHGDPKCDNFLFHANGPEVAVIDLDTVGPGLLSYDLGDCLRSLGNRAGEEVCTETGPDIDISLCRAFAHGYAAMSDYSRQTLEEFFFGGLLTVTFELALRFFTDHLQGDVYFRVEKKGQNLDRAVGQFRLLEAILRRESELSRLLK